MTHRKLNRFRLFNLCSLALLLTGAFLFLQIHGAHASDNQCTNVVLDIGIYDQKASCEVHIEEGASYGVFLEYFYPLEGREDRKLFRKTLGMPVFEADKSEDSKQGHPYSVRLEIAGVSPANNYFMHTKIAPEADIKGKFSVMAELTRVYLLPGVYKMQMTVIRTTPDIKDIQAKVKLVPSSR